MPWDVQGLSHSYVKFLMVAFRRLSQSEERDLGERGRAERQELVRTSLVLRVEMKKNPEPLCREIIRVERAYRPDRRQLRAAVEELGVAARAAGFSLEDIESFLLALGEALANAIEHGCRGRPDSRVWLSYGVGADRLWARVRDEGEGFDPSRVPDPRRGTGLMRSSGRGILMMRGLCDKVEWCRGGTEVRLLKVCLLTRRARSKGKLEAAQWHKKRLAGFHERTATEEGYD